MFNLVVLTGRLTADPELKTTPNGVSVTSFSIAVQRKQKNSNGEYETDFINIVAWRQTAEFITKHFTKGSLIGVEGSIQTRKYKDKDDRMRTVFEVVANNVQFIGAKEKSEENKDVLNDFSEHLQELNEADEDLPF